MAVGVIFEIISVLAIAAGGALTAFSAKKPVRFKNWASAYLVLIAGLAQLGLICGWQWLGHPHESLALIAFIIFDIANFLVIYGTARKWQKQPFATTVNTGGALIALAMILLISITSSAGASWTLAWFIALAAVILVSMTIGLTLSARRHA